LMNIIFTISVFNQNREKYLLGCWAIDQQPAFLRFHQEKTLFFGLFLT